MCWEITLAADIPQGRHNPYHNVFHYVLFGIFAENKPKVIKGKVE
jgi:hypothetical protein